MCINTEKKSNMESEDVERRSRNAPPSKKKDKKKY